MTYRALIRNHILQVKYKHRRAAPMNRSASNAFGIRQSASQKPYATYADAAIVHIRVLFAFSPG